MKIKKSKTQTLLTTNYLNSKMIKIKHLTNKMDKNYQLIRKMTLYSHKKNTETFLMTKVIDQDKSLS
jgi:hypothetical protein